MLYLTVKWIRRRIPLFVVVISAFVFLIEAPHSHSRRSSSSPARSRPRGSVQAYDRSISTISDIGQILQVEYGIESSDKGGSIACFKFSSSTSSSCVCFAIGNSIKGGDKLTSLPLDKVHRVDDHCVLVTTGLAGDGRFLAQTTRLACQHHRLRNGEPPSIREIAQMVAQTQHELTRTSGSRPLGVSATIVGVDPFQNGVETTRIFQCDAGGILDEFEFCASGRGKKRALLELSKLRKQFLVSPRRQDDAGVANGDFDELSSIEALIEGVARIILDAECESACLVDIWLVNTDSSGKAQFRFAKAVSSTDLKTAKRQLSRKTQPAH